MISINSSKPWKIKPPTLYRYENENHIQDFFSHGKLRLSSFTNYRNYTDNALGDKDEGKTPYIQIDSIGLLREDGRNAYTFCTSLKHDEDLKKEFKRNACFKIIDPTNFGIAVANCLSGFIEGIEGYCVYLPLKTVSKYDFPYRTISSLADAMKSNPTETIKLISNIGGNNPNNYFYKHLRYSYQQEYRFLFFVDREVQGNLDIECPEAIQFCRMIKDGEIGDL